MNQKGFGVQPPAQQTVEIFRKKIENYSFLMNDRIGKGFSSIVYRGLNDLTNDVVAIKVIDLKSLKDDIAKSMLDSELECIKSLNHNNLLKCYDSYNTLNNCYIITEYCNEGDLSSKLKSRGKYSEDEFKSLFRQLFQGYSKLAEKGYIHRDLKPANILLKDGVLKIADFGFVKKLTSSPRESYNVGTPLYMSPEAMKDNVYTTKNDIWSMGVMCYELLAGKAPWDCRNQTELKEKVSKNNIRFDQVSISSELQDLILKCLDLDENRRINLQQIQRHPWVKKILTPPDAFPELLNLRSLSAETKPQKCSYVPLKNRSFLSDQNPQNTSTPPPPTNELNNRKILDVLVSMINFCRFNYKLQKKLWGCSMRRYQIDDLVSYLNSDLLSKMNVHEHILRTKDNILKSKDWSSFVSSSDWTKYQNVVEAYVKRYNTSNLEQRLDGSLKTALKSFIRDMSLMMEINQQDRENERNILVLDYVVSYYVLADIWDKFTGNYETFIAFENFAAESHLDQILRGSMDEDGLNKPVVYNSIKYKISSLKI